MRIEVASISSSSGRVTVANADNGKTGAGAVWDYSTKIGSDNALTPNEISLARTLKFNNPNNEAFTVNFNVIGFVEGGGGTSGSSSAGGESSGGSGSTGSASGVTTMLHSLTYNPLLNAITSQLLKL
jgi:hypothetical protein